MHCYWYEFLAFLLFVIFSCTLSVGFLSNALQIMNLTQKVNKREMTWNYNVDNYWSDLSNEFVYNYFENPQSRYFNTHGCLLKDDQFPIHDYLKEIYQNSPQENKNFEDFVGKWIKDSLFYTDPTQNHLVVLNRKPLKTVSFFDIVTKEWQVQTAKSYGQAFNQINEDLISWYKKNNLGEMIIDKNLPIRYQWKNPEFKQVHGLEHYSLESINYHRISNVISNLSNQRLKKMQDNEVLVNDKFAKYHHLKIGDWVDLHDFTTSKNNQQYSLRQTYKIIGFGTKMHNLFVNQDFFNNQVGDTTPNTAFFYLTEHEMESYWSYLWYNYDFIYHLDGSKTSLGRQDIYYQRLKVDNYGTLYRFNNYVKANDFRGQIYIKKSYDELYFVQAFRIYLMSGIILSFLGLLTIIFCMWFVNYFIKKQLKQIRQTLGFLKSMGYKNSQIAFSSWLRTVFLVEIGVMIGYALSIPLQIHLNRLLDYRFYILIQPIWTNLWFLLSIFLFIPLMICLINLYDTNHYLRQNSVKLMTIDKNFVLHDSNLKSKRGFERLHPVKIGRNYLKLSWKGALKSVIFPILFMFGGSLLAIQGNVKTVFDEALDANRHVYNSSFQNRFTFQKPVNWTINSQGKYELQDQNLLNINFQNYNQFSEITANENSQPEVLMKQFLTSKKSLDELREELYCLLVETNFNHQNVNLRTMWQFLDRLVFDYKTYFIEEFPDLKKQVKEWEARLNQAKNVIFDRLESRETVVTLNNVYLHNLIDFPMLQLPLFNDKHWTTSESWILNAVNQRNVQVYQDIDYQMLSDYQGPEGQLAQTFPIVISKHAAALNHWTIGDEFKADLNDPYVQIRAPIKFKIIGINHDLTTNNFYCLQETFMQLCNPLNVKKPWFNTVFSRQGFFNLDSNNLKDLTIKTPYFNYYYSTSYDFISLVDLFQNAEAIMPMISWENLLTPAFKSMAFERHIVKQKLNDLNKIMNKLIFFTMILTLTLILVFFIISTVDQEQKIKLYKAFGRQNFTILWLLNWPIILAFFIGMGLLIFVNQQTWVFFTKFFFWRYKIMLYTPIDWMWILGTLIIMIIIFSIGLIASRIVIQKTSPVFN